jgi:preprotein translocase subunit SecA
LPENLKSDGVDFNELDESIYRIFNVHLDFSQYAQNGAKRSDVMEYVRERVQSYYDEKENQIGSETLRQIEKYIMLQTIDYLWKDHLLSMDHLREGIGLRGYAQKDPLYEYKKEGFEMFSGMLYRCNEDVCEKLFRVQPISDVDMERLERRRRLEQQKQMVLGRGEGEEKRKPVKREKKVGRNDPCPCGSGKKYKKCHGRS